MGCGGIGGIIASSLVEHGVDTVVVAHNPVIADAINRRGFIDDAAVLGLVFAAAETDLRGYCEWRGLDPTNYF